jgi:hypothetical protein
MNNLDGVSSKYCSSPAGLEYLPRALDAETEGPPQKLQQSREKRARRQVVRVLLRNWSVFPVLLVDDDPPQKLQAGTAELSGPLRESTDMENSTEGQNLASVSS